MVRANSRLIRLRSQPNALFDDARLNKTNATFSAKEKGGVLNVDLYDEIGFWGVTAKRFSEVLKASSAGTINLRINSPGGDVFDGIAIYNDLVNHAADVNVTVTGLAASAASLVAMAGDDIAIADNAFLMIHNAWAFAIGDENEMRSMAKTLGQIDGALARTYAKQTGSDEKDLRALMDAETWMDGGDAVDRGFADRVVDADSGSGASASFDLSNFQNAPSALRGWLVPKQEAEVVESLAPVMAAIERLNNSLQQ